MPITPEEKEHLASILKKLNTIEEALNLAGLIYNSLQQSNLPTQSMMLLGKALYAGLPWQKVPNHLRVHIVEAGEKKFLPGFIDIFKVATEQEIKKEELIAAGVVIASEPAQQSEEESREDAILAGKIDADPYPSAPPEELDIPEKKTKEEADEESPPVGNVAASAVPSKAELEEQEGESDDAEESEETEDTEEDQEEDPSDDHEEDPDMPPEDEDVDELEETPTAADPGKAVPQ